MRHAFWKSCLTCCVMSVIVRSSRIAFENFENMCVSCRTVVCRDVWVGDTLWGSFNSNIDI